MLLAMDTCQKQSLPVPVTRRGNARQATGSGMGSLRQPALPVAACRRHTDTLTRNAQHEEAARTVPVHVGRTQAGSMPALWHGGHTLPVPGKRLALALARYRHYF